MEQYTNKQPTNSTSKSNRTNTDSSQRRIDQQQSTTHNSAITTNEHSDFESGDENHHPTINGFSTETFPNPTTINVDSDTTSTSSQTSSEHDQQSTTNNNNNNNNNNNTNTNWQHDRTSRFPSNTNNNLVQSTTTTTTINSNNLLTESTNSSAKTFDQLPEYKLFSSNAPSIHHLLFGSSNNNNNINNNNNNNNNNATNQQLTRTTLINGIDHDVREIEKRLMENCRINRDSTSYTQMQENDELGFDPCSLFMSALASDIEDEQKPMPTNFSFYRPTMNSFNYPQQYSTTNPPIGQINPNWLTQQQQYHQYHDSHSNGTTKQQQQQQRYPNLFNGSSPRQMWNGNQPTQYASQQSARLDYPNQIQQRLPIRQAHSPSSQYSQTLNHPNTNNDRWTSPSWTDPAIISCGNKLDPTTSSSSQWSSTTQSQGSSTLSSGTNLIPPIRWSQHANVSSSSSSSSSQSRLIPNGNYSPYSTRSGVDDANRS